MEAPRDLGEKSVMIWMKRGAFALVRCLDVERVAVVDDVMTTGSTVEELARLLKALAGELAGGAQLAGAGGIGGDGAGDVGLQ